MTNNLSETSSIFCRDFKYFDRQDLPNIMAAAMLRTVSFFRENPNLTIEGIQNRFGLEYNSFAQLPKKLQIKVFQELPMTLERWENLKISRDDFYSSGSLVRGSVFRDTDIQELHGILKKNLE